MAIVSDIVARLGGTRHLASAAAIKPSTIQSWKKANWVPSRRIPEIIAAAARLDPPVHLRPDDFFDLPAVTATSPTPTAAQPSP